MKKIVALISFLMLTGLFAFQLITPKTRAQDILPPNAFLIRNKTGPLATFWLRKGTGEWMKYQLDATDRNTYEDKDQLWIKDPGQDPVHKTLKVGNRYVLKWKGTKWDVELMELP